MCGRELANANLSRFEICFESSAPITSGRSGSRRPSILYTEVCVCWIPYKAKLILLLPPVIAVLQGEIITILFSDFYFMWSTSENLKRFQFTRKKKSSRSNFNFLMYLDVFRVHWSNQGSERLLWGASRIFSRKAPSYKEFTSTSYVKICLLKKKEEEGMVIKVLV